MTPASVKLIFISLPARICCEATAPIRQWRKGPQSREERSQVARRQRLQELVCVPKSDAVEGMGLIIPHDTQTQKHLIIEFVSFRSQNNWQSNSRLFSISSQ